MPWYQCKKGSSSLANKFVETINPNHFLFFVEDKKGEDSLIITRLKYRKTSSIIESVLEQEYSRELNWNTRQLNWVIVWTEPVVTRSSFELLFCCSHFYLFIRWWIAILIHIISFIFSFIPVYSTKNRSDSSRNQSRLVFQKLCYRSIWTERSIDPRDPSLKLIQEKNKWRLLNRSSLSKDMHPYKNEMKTHQT